MVPRHRAARLEIRFRVPVGIVWVLDITTFRRVSFRRWFVEMVTQPYTLWDPSYLIASGCAIIQEDEEQHDGDGKEGEELSFAHDGDVSREGIRGRKQRTRYGNRAITSWNERRWRVESGDLVEGGGQTPDGGKVINAVKRVK